MGESHLNMSSYDRPRNEFLHTLPLSADRLTLSEYISVGLEFSEAVDSALFPIPTPPLYLSPGIRSLRHLAVFSPKTLGMIG